MSNSSRSDQRCGRNGADNLSEGNVLIENCTREKKTLCPSMETNGSGDTSDCDQFAHDRKITLLRELVQNREWEALMQRVEDDPDEASLQNERGRTALHHLCAVSDELFPPINVVRGILNACVAASWTQDDFGWTPLSLACSNNAPEGVIRLLLDAHLAPVSMQTHCGMTPLYLATWSRAPFEVLEILLQVGPSLVLWPTIVEETPLTLFWTENKDSLLRGLTEPNVCDAEADQRPDTTSEEDWQRLELFLKAAFHESITDPLPGNVKFRALHAACAIGCPLELVKAVMKKYPEQIWERDEYGRLPLTLAASAPVYLPPSTKGEGIEENDALGPERSDYEGGDDVSQDDEGNSIDLGDVQGGFDRDDDIQGQLDPRTDGDRVYPEVKLKSNQSDQSVIDFLLEANPIAAKFPDPHGRLPLYLAIESGKCWNQGLRALLNATPEALASRDNVTHMYPFMLAAVDDLQPIDVVFELLCTSPQALGTCFPVMSRKSAQ